MVEMEKIVTDKNAFKEMIVGTLKGKAPLTFERNDGTAFEITEVRLVGNNTLYVSFDVIRPNDENGFYRLLKITIEDFRKYVSREWWISRDMSVDDMSVDEMFRSALKESENGFFLYDAVVVVGPGVD